LYQNRDLFATSLKDLPASDICYHTIETTTDTPIRQRQFRHPPHVENEIDKHCNELLDADIIQHSQSPYNNPVFLIKKSSGEYRFIVDFRKLNSITVPKFYQLPSLEQTIDQVGRLKPVLISSLDAKSGYYSLPLDPATAHKTAFSTRTSKFQFKRLCFGLQGSPSTYCMAMSKLLNSLHEQVVCYIDDALIMSGVSPSGNMTAHIAILQKVFDKYREAKLRFSPQKCQFAQTSVKYLGHIFGSEGIQIDESKIEVIRTYEAPKNTKQLKSFLGLTNYWRRFICSYSAITQPLRDLLKQDVPYVWGKEQEEAFQMLKEKLCTAPVLVYPDMTKSFRITSDASKYALGYILSQLDSTGQERVISYQGRSTRSYEQNYSATELELAAIMQAVITFHPYIATNKFEIVTDHVSLSYIKNLKLSNSRLMRWSLLLQQYDYTIRHVPGKRLAHCDALSRRSYPPDDTTTNFYDVDPNTHLLALRQTKQTVAAPTPSSQSPNADSNVNISDVGRIQSGHADADVDVDVHSADLDTEDPVVQTPVIEQITQ